MKRSGLVFSVVLFMFFGLLAYAQEPNDNPKPPKQEQQKPEPMPDTAQPPKQEEAKPPKQEEPKTQKQEMPKSQKEENTQPAHAQPKHEGKRGGHIPDEKFRASFGRQHTFVVSRPVIIENRPRFQYASYWFEFVDPWPTAWAYTDDCYIEFIDGEYFLFNVRHPGERVLVFVVM